MIIKKMLIGLLGIILLSACTPTASVIGISNTPIHYTYAPGYSPPQSIYPVPTDANTNIDNSSTIEKEIIINEDHDSLAAEQKQKEAAELQAIQRKLNSIIILQPVQ